MIAPPRDLPSLPVHAAGWRCEELALGDDSWPHVHLRGPEGTRAVVEVSLDPWPRPSRDWSGDGEDSWEVDVRPPGRLDRWLGDTMELRIERAALRLEARWAARQDRRDEARRAIEGAAR